MSTKTENLKLTKPAATDLVDISAINENMDIIDENLITKAEVNELKENLDKTDASLKSGYEAADASISKDLQNTKRDLQTTATRIDNRITETAEALRHENELTKRDLQNTDAIIDNRIDNLVANTGDSNSEIVDARVGNDEVTYGSLGTAIRTQVKNVYGDLRATTERIEDEVDKKVKSLRLYRDDEGYLCETEE